MDIGEGGAALEEPSELPCSCISILAHTDSDAGGMQVIAQAWNTWKSSHVEQKRLRAILAKVALRLKNRVSYHVHSCISILAHRF